MLIPTVLKVLSVPVVGLAMKHVPVFSGHVGDWRQKIAGTES